MIRDQYGLGLREITVWLGRQIGMSASIRVNGSLRTYEKMYLTRMVRKGIIGKMMS